MNRWVYLLSSAAYVVRYIFAALPFLPILTFDGKEMETLADVNIFALFRRIYRLMYRVFMIKWNKVTMSRAD